MENSIEIPEHLISGGEAITINLIGVGGTGSWVLGDLIALHHYLVETGRLGLKVRAYDPDIVTEANLGRQNFNSADLNENKAVALVEKYNRYWGLNWEGIPEEFSAAHKQANITICCVDSIESRRKIIEAIRIRKKRAYDDSEYPHFLIDCGNGYDYGQIIVTPLWESGHKTFLDYFPDQKENITEPSCSVLESLGKQNLFINKFMANLAVNWLYEGIRNTEQSNLGYFFNFNSLTPIYL